MNFFELGARQGSARTGRVHTLHGSFQTPAFLPVGTLGTVKGILPDQLRALNVEVILGNTYHLHLRPGETTVRDLGGLHQFMGWDGPILTDSGGFQVFSLAQNRKLDEEGVTFQSHIDGSAVRLTPVRSLEIQRDLGSDIWMPLDVCPAQPATRASLEEAVAHTLKWARISRDWHANQEPEWMGHLFGIVQGGSEPGLRESCAQELVEMDFSGYSIGGVAVGESKEKMQQAVELTVPLLPESKPRYLMGVGNPEDLLMAVERGVDFFDCVTPTRNGRNSLAYTTKGKVKLRNAQWARAEEPLDADCDCPTCQKFSRAYLRHLFVAGEMLGPILTTMHNLRFFTRFMEGMRDALEAGCWEAYRDKWSAVYPRSGNGEDLDLGHINPGSGA